MKILIFIIGLMLVTGRISAQTSSGGNDSQFKVMLEQIAKLQMYIVYLKKGYDIVHYGLTVIGDLKRGDLTLHRLFFDRLKTVSPVIKNYYKTADILIRYQQMTQAVSAYNYLFAQSVVLTSNEQSSIAKVFSLIMDKMNDELDRLETVMADQSLAMNDGERLARIDYLHTEVLGLFSELFHIGTWVQTGISQRKAENQSFKQLESLY